MTQDIGIMISSGMHPYYTRQETVVISDSHQQPSHLGQGRMSPHTELSVFPHQDDRGLPCPETVPGYSSKFELLKGD